MISPAIVVSVPQRARALAASDPTLSPEEIARRLGARTSQVQSALAAKQRRRIKSRVI